MNIKRIYCILIICFQLFNASNLPNTNKFLICPTPKSIMLHSWYGSQKTESLIVELINSGYEFYTYLQIYLLSDIGKCAPKNAVIISIDDFYVQWRNPVLVDMVDVLLKHNLIATLGLITGTENSNNNNDNWKYYYELSEKGFEIASHSVSHLNPYELDIEELENELNKSYEIVCKNLGKCPSSYILPYGIGWDYDKLIQIAREHYKAVISIGGPSTYSGDFFIMKRMSPGYCDVSETLRKLEKAFPWFSTQKLIRQNLQDDRVGFKHIALNKKGNIIKYNGDKLYIK